MSLSTSCRFLSLCVQFSWVHFYIINKSLYIVGKLMVGFIGLLLLLGSLVTFRRPNGSPTLTKKIPPTQALHHQWVEQISRPIQPSHSLPVYMHYHPPPSTPTPIIVFYIYKGGIELTMLLPIGYCTWISINGAA